MNTKLTEFRTARGASPLLAFAGTKKPGASPGFGVLVGG